MADDDVVMIEGVYGEYRDRRLTVPEAKAKAYIKNRWARDPFAPPSDKPAEPIDDEERFKILEASRKDARELRGEDVAEDDRKAKALEPEKPGEYQTRAAAKSKSDK